MLRIGLAAAELLALLVAALLPALGQGMQYEIHSEKRLFPTIGPGVVALKRDAAGNYYILAEPADRILVFDAAQRPKGQIPNANSAGAVIRYAVGMDLDSEGRLYVADRGANAVKVFAPDGAPIANVPVTAPTSVVALSDGQFAVTKLQSKRLVQIMDQTGATIRTFGDPGDLSAAPTSTPSPVAGRPTPPVPPVDRGRITGDRAGNIYFAFTSLADPAVQRFDRWGYSAYDSVMPATDFGALGGRNGRDVELGYSISGITGADTVSAWTDLHSVKASVSSRGERRGRTGTGPGTTGSGTNSSATSDSSTAAIAGDDISDSSDYDGEILNYNGQTASDTSLFGTSGLGMLGPGFAMPGMMGMGFGDPFRMGGFPRAFGDFGADHTHPDFPGGRPDGEGFGHFHPGFNTYRSTVTVRVALDDPSKRKLAKPVITAMAVDPQTEEAWAAIGDMLVHLGRNGNRLDTYYVTITGDTTAKASAILVEPSRILIASDSWGIYEFARPDNSSRAQPTGHTAVAQPLAPPTSK